MRIVQAGSQGGNIPCFAGFFFAISAQRGSREVIDPSTEWHCNPGKATEVGIQFTGHKTVAMFSHYVRTEAKPVRDAPN